jgi:hypothetical protein
VNRLARLGVLLLLAGCASGGHAHKYGTYIGPSGGGSGTIADGSITPAKLSITIQDSSAIAVTGGTINGTNLNLVNAWADARAVEQRALVPGLTRWKRLNFGLVPIGMTAGRDNSALRGDGASLNVGAATALDFSTNAYYFPKTVGWAVSYRAIFRAPAASNLAILGMRNAAGSHAIQAGFDNAQDTTHFMFKIVGAGTTVVISAIAAGVIPANTAVDLTLACDATTLTMMINGVSVATTTTLTNLSDEVMSLYFFNTVSNDLTLLDGLIGVVL